jgi:amino acid transporter
MGWTYFFAGAMFVCVEYAAVATVMQYWITSVNPAAWIAMAVVSCMILNVLAVRWYGESEFFMAITKVLLIVGLICLTFITMVGGNPRNDAYGFRYWTKGNAMHPYYTTGTTGRFLGFWSAIRYAAFTVAGPDLIALAAGEIQNPRRTIPRVARLVFYRLVGFYIVGILAVGILCNSRDPNLMGAIEAGATGSAGSPWVIGIQNLGITGLPSLINAVILLSGWSCGNAYLYSSSRTLYSLSRDGHAPKIFMKCTKTGIPVYTVLAVSAIGCLTFLVASSSAVEVFYWFVDLATCAIVLTYVGMLITFMFWLRALKAQNIPRDLTTLPYVAPLAPYSAWCALIVGSLVLFFIGFDSFVPWSTRGFVTAYFGLGFGLVMFCFWKLWKRTRFVRAAECDLVSGKKEIDEDCAVWEQGGIDVNERARLAGMPVWRRWWEKIW